MTVVTPSPLFLCVGILYVQEETQRLLSVKVADSLSTLTAYMRQKFLCKGPVTPALCRLAIIQSSFISTYNKSSK